MVFTELLSLREQAVIDRSVPSIHSFVTFDSFVDCSSSSSLLSCLVTFLCHSNSSRYSHLSLFTFIHTIQHSRLIEPISHHQILPLLRSLFTPSITCKRTTISPATLEPQDDFQFYMSETQSFSFTTSSTSSSLTSSNNTPRLPSK